MWKLYRVLSTLYRTSERTCTKGLNKVKVKVRVRVQGKGYGIGQSKRKSKGEGSGKSKGKSKSKAEIPVSILYIQAYRTTPARSPMRVHVYIPRCTNTLHLYC